MKAALRVLAKDLAELVLSPRALVALLAVPPLILVLVGLLQKRPPTVELLVAGLGDCELEESIDETATATYRYLRELAWVELACDPDTEREPLRRLEEGRFDMLLNLDEAEEGRWVIHVDETRPRRVRWLLKLAHGIQLSRREVSEAEGAILIFYKLSTLGALPLRSALLYYPDSERSSVAMLPSTFGLIICFLPFVIAAPSLIRERESHTLEILLGAPGMRGDSILLGKCLLSVSVALLSALLMLLTVQTTYHLYVKAGSVVFLLFLILPVLSSVLLGLTVSALARSQTQTVMAAAVYFLCLLLLTGFLYPTEGSGMAIQILSRFFGLTFLLDRANAWMFGADFRQGLAEPVRALALQCGVYAAIAWLAWRRQLRRV